MTTPEFPDRFHVAFSFSGEERDFVREIATAVQKKLEPGSVFFDEWYEAIIAGYSAAQFLQDIYSQRAKLVVLCASPSHGQKPWTLAERAAADALRFTLENSEDATARLRVLPMRVSEGFRFDQTQRGYLPTTIYMDAIGKTAAKTAELIIMRLRTIDPTIRLVGEPPRHVYLSATVAAQRDKAGLDDWLKDHGWLVFDPATATDADEALASIQLLDPLNQMDDGNAAPEGGQLPATPGLPAIRWRKASENSGGRASGADNTICSTFADFQVYLKAHLASLWQKKKVSIEEDTTDESARRVHVVVRSERPDARWARVLEWLLPESDVATELLGKDETIQAKFAASPCQGFIVVCDATAHAEETQAAHADLKACLQIQLGIKKLARKPPVGIVYFPPPSPDWGRLLRIKPFKPHPIWERPNPASKNETENEPETADRPTPVEFRAFLADLRAVPA
jgi:hypothetical protein